MSENKGKSSFVLYHDIRAPLELLSDEDRGKLFLALLDYSEYGVTPAFNGALQMAFAFIRAALDRDADAWEAKREKRREAGSMGGKQRAANQASATFASKMQAREASQAVPVPVPVPAPVIVPVPGNVPVNESSADKPPRAQRFTPPSVEEVKAYCLERKNNVDAQRFVDFYTANGWTQGRGKTIKDWRAAVRTWERGENNGSAADHGKPESSAGKRFNIKYDVE